MKKANSTLMAACLIAALFAQATEMNVKTANTDINVKDAKIPEPKTNVKILEPKTNVKIPEPKTNVNIPEPKTDVKIPEPKTNAGNTGEIGAAVGRAMDAGPILNQPTIPAHSLPGSGAIDGQKPQRDY